MAVKIIKLPEPEVFQIDCNHCKATLQYEEDDIRKNMTGLFNVRVKEFIHCPKCNKTVTIKEYWEYF